MSAFRLTDAQQAAAVDSVDRNVVLTSGAGCGKTAVLAFRFAELLKCSDRDDAVRRLVAVTFTEKAAVEMRQRLAGLLSDMATEADPSRRQQIQGWIDDLPEARISTIHSFCAGILRTHAVRAGIDPAFDVLAEQIVADQMVDDAVNRAVITAVEGGGEAVAALLVRRRFETVLAAVAELVEQRTAYNPADYADADTIFARWDQRLAAQRTAAQEQLADDTALAAELDALLAIECKDPTDKLAVWLREHVSLARLVMRDSEAWTSETFATLSEKAGGIGSAKNWPLADVKELRHRMKAALAPFADLAVLAAGELGELDRQAAEDLATLTALASDANALYAAAKRSRGAMDFDDLQDCTDRLLRANPDVQAQLAAGIDQLLIDECQDTNPIQMELLWRLIAGESLEAPPGKLFVVGDVKQSIYRFRGADVSLFGEIARRLGEDGRLSLGTSFRTHAAGLALVNRLFAPLIGDGYEAIDAFREDTPPSAPVEILLASNEDGDMNAEKATAAQAALVAERIRELVDSGEPVVWDAAADTYRPARYADIAILFVRMTASAEYERQLAAAGVPYYVVAGAEFFHQQEVYDLLNALRVIDDPYSDTALVGVLRSSLVGLDDNALMHLAEVCEKPLLPSLPHEDLARRLNKSAAQALHEAIQWIGELSAGKDAAGLDELIERIVTECGYEATLLAQPQGKRKVGNVRLLISHARSAAAEGMSLADFITQMDKLTLTDARYEQAAVAGEADDVVRLMTIHKAKGLEFPIVVVPDLNAGGRGSHRGCLLHQRDWGWTTKPPGGDDDDGEKPLSAELARQAEQRDDLAETIRKYYVALTRHEDRLILIGADQRNKDGTIKGNCFLRTLDEQLGVLTAVDDGRDEIVYNWDGRDYAMRVQRRIATPTSSRQAASAGRALLNDAADGADLAARALAAASTGDNLPLIGPLPSSVGQVELAVTALSEFVQCPQRYRWRYDLRVPQTALPREADGAARESAGPDAASAGTFFHRCMELLDFDAPQTADTVARQAAAETGIGDEFIPSLTAELADMIEQFRQTPLWQQLASAEQSHRELDFILSTSSATLRGQIDLLTADADGTWRIVDYKSDRLNGADVAEHSRHHELQMRIYAAAAAGFLGSPPAEAVLYYLRTGETHTISFDDEMIASIQNELGDLAGQLITARRTGEFASVRGEQCEYCAYRALCE